MPTIGDVERETRLNAVLADYFDTIESGQDGDRETLLARHPDLAAELRAFFSEQEELSRLALPLRTLLHAEQPAALIASSQTDRENTAPTESSGSEQPPLLFGDYELLEQIGQGGMGLVYRARWRRLDRLVALKMIRTGPWATSADVQRFRAEAEVVAMLDHPHIVPIYDIGQYAGHLYFSMKLIDGGNLADVIAGRNGAILPIADVNSEVAGKDPVRRSAALVANLALAVHHAHQRGVLHRDLKPSNILLDAAGNPYVSDFGLAKRTGTHADLTQTGAILGTPEYLAPEQVSGERQAVTTAVDVYGLGTILYSLLTGRPPLRGATPLDTLTLLKQRDPDPPSRYNQSVDRDLEAICLKCLEKEPHRRYGSALALTEDLERWLAGAPTSARPVGRLDRMWRWCRRNRLLAALTSLVAVLLVVGVAGLVVGLIVVSQSKQAVVHQRALLRERLYASDVNRAHRFWQEGQLEQSAAVLAEYDPRPGEDDLRGFEWYFLSEQIRHIRQTKPLVTLRVDKGVNCVASIVSPDCRWAAFAGRDGKILLFDLPDGEQRPQIDSPGGAMAYLCFSPDGGRLAGAGQDHKIRLWNLADGQEQAVLSGDGKAIYFLAFSPDGMKLASCGEGPKVHIWDLARQSVEVEFTLSAAKIVWLAFAADGQKVLCADFDGHVTLCDLTNGQSLWVYPVLGRALSVAISSDATRLAAGDDHGQVHLWQALRGQLVRKVIGHERAASAVQFSPDGNLLASCGDDGRVRIWSTLDGALRGQLVAHDDVVWTACFSPDGQTLATTSADQTVKLWNVGAVCQTPGLLPLTDSTAATICFSPDLQTLATSRKDGIVQLWQTHSSKRQGTWPDYETEVYRLSFSRDGKYLAACRGGGNCIFRDLTNYEPLRDEAGKVLTFPGAAAVLTPDNTTVISSDWHTATVSERATGRVIRQIAAKGTLFSPISLTLSPDGRTAALGRGDGGISLWDWASANTRDSQGRHQMEVIRVEFSPDASLLASISRDGGIKLWRAATLEEVSTMSGHSEGGVLAFSPDGKTLASGGEDSAVKLWHVATGQELFALEAHRGPVLAVAFSPDGGALAAAGVPTGRSEAECYLWFAR